MSCIRFYLCSFCVNINNAVERLREFGDESRLESLRAEIAQEKIRKKQLEESVAVKQSEVSLIFFLV